jgi:ABC-2 type transport system ATP-binding protein
MTAAIEAIQLTRRFGDFTAVSALSISVETGEIFGLLGPNGAGKTTAIKMLTGLMQPSEGTARIAGFDVERESEQVKRRLGYMSQLFSLYPDLTVDENIVFFAGLYGVTGARLEKRRAWVLEMAGLDRQRDTMTSALPLGWKQRLALGCAVLHEPPVLFLDEPTSGVDPLSRRRFWDLIQALAESGTTVLISTHYLEEAEYCHRVALMNRGRLVALDRPVQLRGEATDPLFELETPNPLRAVEVLTGDPGVVDAVLFGRKVHLTLHEGKEADRRIGELLGASGIAVTSLEPVAPSLEDAVVSLIRRTGGAADD